MKATSDNFPKSGNVSYEILGAGEAVYTLDINPALKLLRLRCPNGEVHVTQTYDEWRKTVLPSLIPREIYEMVCKYLNEIIFYFQSYFGPLIYNSDQDEPSLTLDDDPYVLEYFGEEGKYTINAYPTQELLHIIMPDSKFFWMSYSGVRSNTDLLEFIDEGLPKYLSMILEDRTSRPGKGFKVYTEKLWGEIPFRLSVNKEEGFIALDLPARSIWTNAEMFYHDSRILGLQTEIEDWILDKLEENGFDLKVLAATREQAVKALLQNLEKKKS